MVEAKNNLSQILQKFNEVKLFSNHFSKNIAKPTSNYEFKSEDLLLYRVEEITYEEDSPRLEALENVFSCMAHPGVNFVYLIRGTADGVSFYFGFMRDYSTPMEYRVTDSVANIARSFLKPALEGNFRGSIIQEISKKESAEIQKDIVRSIETKEHCLIMNGVPGIVEEKEKQSFRGIDRLIDVMQGDDFGFMVIANALNKENIQQIHHSIFRVYEMFAPFVKIQKQEGESKQSTKGTGNYKDETQTENWGESSGTSTNYSHTKGENWGESWGTSTNCSHTEGKNWGESWGTSTNCSHTEGKNEGKSWGTSRNSSYTKKVKSEGGGSHQDENKGWSTSYSEGGGTHQDENKGWSTSYSKGGGTHQDKNKGWSTSDSEGSGTHQDVNKGWSNSVSKGTNFHEDFSSGSDQHFSLEFTNKYAENWVKYFDDVLIPRLDYGLGKGIFTVSTLLFGATQETVIKLSNAARSIFSGDKANMVPLTAHPAGPNERQYVGSLQLATYNYPNEVASLIPYCEALLATRPGTIGNWMTSRELAMIAGLPQKEVIGLRLKEEVEFGLNIPHEVKCKEKSGNDNVKTSGTVELGKLVKSGNVCVSISVPLKKDQLDRHIFVAGVTGCGKTTTCQNLLLSSDWPFLVIEPAKTEYRGLRNEACKDLLVFTLGNDNVAPFRLNPFEFIKGENITSHVDMLMASIVAAFDMEAAIPQLIERAIYASYDDMGWSIKDNSNRFYDDPFADNVFAFPTLSDVLAKIDKVVGEQGFDERLKRDYIGSIKARLQGLTLGAKGLMLDCRRSVDFDKLLDRKVVLELEEIPNSQQKSLIIGFILTNLIQVIKSRYERTGGKKVCHITLIEEAHRLLTKPEPGGSSSQRQAAETFADMLAEVRKYGESLIIADQIPGKLTPEVIKNTNTKIIHRLFAQDDKEAVGHAMGLKDEQIEFLSNLKVGHAIVFNGAWSTKPVQVKINELHETDSAIAEDEKIKLREVALAFYQENLNRGELSENSAILAGSSSKIDDIDWLLKHDKELDREIAFIRGKSLDLECLNSMCMRFGRDKVFHLIAMGYWDEKCQDEVLKLLGKVMASPPDLSALIKLRQISKYKTER